MRIHLLFFHRPQNLYLLLNAKYPTLSGYAHPAATLDSMKLSTFIITNMEQVLAEWDRFAKTLEPEALPKKRVRDHAELILRAIAADIDTHQSAEQQKKKSQGLSPENIVASGAAVHGTARQHDGFSLLQLTSEFRALRATVQRL